MTHIVCPYPYRTTRCKSCPVLFSLYIEKSGLHPWRKSFILFVRASLAQRLEHRICNARVVGSIPTGGLLRTRPSFVVTKPCFGREKCLGRLMDGQQPSKLFCVGSIPVRDEAFRLCFLASPIRYRQRATSVTTRVVSHAFAAAGMVLSILYLKASSFLLRRGVVNGYKFQEGSKGIPQTNQ